MNNVTITADTINPQLTHIKLILSLKAEVIFKANVFPLLYDGKTSGVRTKLLGGRVRYTLLVYDTTLIEAFKKALANAILLDNGQMN